ncbi:MAG TPA: threonine dehydratase [Candidatus Acidoferrales bacterium]|nr:threonine dehydratase [Candidatus Acidoferrales bacterium]
MTLPDLGAIERAAEIVYRAMPPTPQYRWPLLCERAGTEVWVKHENHTPLGAFKIRSGLVYFRHLKQSGGANGKVVAATRGNFGQAVALGARREGMEAVVFVPHGNSPAKNRAMRALGACLIEHGEDFEEARREAARRAEAEGWHYVPSFHEWLVEGTATYSLELFRAVPDIDVAFVPIGLGSGISGMCAAREALGVKTEIVGVVSAHARAYAESFARRRAVECPVTTRIADGMACRAAHPDALEVMWRHVSRVVTVTDDEVEEAIRAAYDDTHNLAEGGGAAAIAAMLKEKGTLRGKRAAVVMSGGNVDREVYAEVLRG